MGYRGVLAVAVATLSASFGHVLPLRAQDPMSEQANRALALAFESTWNKHDMRAWGALFTEDVDYVGVTACHAHGRDEVEGEHAESHAGVRFKDSVWSLRDVKVTFLKPDVGLLHITWAIRGVRYWDGTPSEPREGTLTCVTVNEGGTWKIRALHASSKE